MTSMRGFLPLVVLSAFLFTGLYASHAHAATKPNTNGIVEQLIRIKAEQGDATAQYNLGVMYANGKGMTQDDKQAAFWFRKSADQGYAEAQLILGVMYNEGQGGMSKDYSQAVA
ncbi:MAG: sel1 repeat family protein, partial [Methylococcaceae bacterium]|nr:sel1 repeat family protein [Methylococcaceae bacterium]